MASDDSGDRTEQPTEHRRREEREKGNVARSQDLNAASLMVAVAMALAYLGDGLIQSLIGMLGQSIRNANRDQILPSDAVRMMHGAGEYGLITVAMVDYTSMKASV